VTINLQVLARWRWDSVFSKWGFLQCLWGICRYFTDFFGWA